MTKPCLKVVLFSYTALCWGKDTNVPMLSFVGVGALAVGLGRQGF